MAKTVYARLFDWYAHYQCGIVEDFFSFYHAQIGGKFYLFFVVLPGLLIRLIKRLGKISIPGCKLEYWIYMVLSLLRITGKMFSSTCFSLGGEGIFFWSCVPFTVEVCGLTVYLKY